jgi:uncharacterized membrane protein YbaN (DUF454 family)
MLRDRKSKDPPTVLWRLGAIHLYDRRLFADPAGDSVRQFLARVFALADVSSIEINHRAAAAIIRFPRDKSAGEMLKRLTAALGGSEPAANQFYDLLTAADRHRQTTNVFRVDGSFVVIPVAFGMRRLAYLTLAGGSFVMSIIGVAVPGIPTVPFVILTSYFLVRSSPAMNEWLLRSRLFGPMLRDWQTHGAVRPRVKWISIGVTLVILVASVVLAEISGPLLAVVLVLAAFGIYLILRLPTLKEPQPSVPAVSDIGLAGAI